MGPFGTIERPWKPFNPILGETFEFAKPDKGIKYIAEQVGAACGCCWGVGKQHGQVANSSSAA